VVEVYPNSQLFGDNKVLQAMLLGDVQIAAPSLSKFKRFTKKLQLFDLPFLFKDMAAVERFQQSDKGQELLNAIRKKGLIGLGYIHYMVVTSVEFWMDLPDDVRSEVKKALDEAIVFGNRVAAQKSVDDRQRIIDSGRSKVITLSPEERAQWIEVMKPVWKQFEDEIGKELIDAAYNANNM
jgi:TRAP-type C4-dicarboxylate transport system substrate-binding protein